MGYTVNVRNTREYLRTVSKNGWTNRTYSCRMLPCRGRTMRTNRNMHQRRSIRLKGDDYVHAMRHHIVCHGRRDRLSPNSSPLQPNASTSIAKRPAASFGNAIIMNTSSSTTNPCAVSGNTLQKNPTHWDVDRENPSSKRQPWAGWRRLAGGSSMALRSPGELAAERSDPNYGDVVLENRLRQALT